MGSATIHSDSGGTHGTLARKWDFIQELRSRKFDTAYILKRSFGSAVMALLSGARRRVGFATEGRSLLLTKSVPYRHDQHEVQKPSDVLRQMEYRLLMINLRRGLLQKKTVCRPVSAQCRSQAGRTADRHSILLQQTHRGHGIWITLSNWQNVFLTNIRHDYFL